MLINDYIRLILIDSIKRLNIFGSINILIVNGSDYPIKATALVISNRPIKDTDTLLMMIAGWKGSWHCRDTVYHHVIL